MKRRVLAVLLTVALWLGLSVPVMAIADPDTLLITNVWAYQHVLEADDQLYVVDFTIEYAVNPTENAGEAFLVRLLDGGAQLGSIAPYAYFDDGYVRGVASIYFSAADAPAWSGVYDIEVIGNPLLAWGGAIPSTTLAVSNWSASAGIQITSVEIGSRVLVLAQILEAAWPLDLIEPAGGGGNQLTSYGETYFTAVIQDLTTISPTIFSIQEYVPSYPDKTFSQPYEASLAASVVGTPLDMTDLGTALGVSTMWVSGLLYAVVCVVLLILVARGTGSTKGVMALTVPLVVVGALLGVIPLTAAIMLGFIAGVLTLWSLFGKGASA